MPVLKLYRQGVTAGTPPQKNDHLRSERGEVKGWTIGATRRNTAFLRSVDERLLEDGAPFALTLTLRDCPPTPEAWHRLRTTWEKRVRRLGMIRMHWVTEWTRRRLPHLHCAIWFPHPAAAYKARAAWIELAAMYGAGPKGQHVTPIHDAIGWFQYTAKHASRGVKHYQRNPEGIPEAWKTKTGKVWGKCGTWPLVPPVRVHLENDSRGGDGGYFAFRRMIRALRVSQSRASGDWFRVRQAKRMLSAETRAQSTVRGISEWPPIALQLRMLGNLVERGFAVQHLAPKDG